MDRVLYVEGNLLRPSLFMEKFSWTHLKVSEQHLLAVCFSKLLWHERTASHKNTLPSGKISYFYCKHRVIFFLKYLSSRLKGRKAELCVHRINNEENMQLTFPLNLRLINVYWPICVTQKQSREGMQKEQFVYLMLSRHFRNIPGIHLNVQAGNLLFCVLEWNLLTRATIWKCIAEPALLWQKVEA